MTINITKALSIQGWMSDEELTWLAQQASTHKVIVEVGCYAGRSTRALADHTSGKIITVDDFLGSDKERPLSKEDSVKLYSEFRENLQEHLEGNKLVVCHPSDIGDTRYKSLTPDMVFIDGDHSYEGVARDIKYWGSRLKPGGLLSGHDSGYEPIKKALQDLLPLVQFVPRTSIWYVGQ
jgi:predicted O-methyltransferase YrrM